MGLTLSVAIYPFFPFFLRVIAHNTAELGVQVGGKKIAVLGSGIGSLSAVYELIKANPSYDITVYQMGWRCGGKGASGRNLDPAYSYRIEEHGLHMWSGLYENAFRLMRECYDGLGRPGGSPLATVDDAFKPHSSFVLFELYKGEWLPWKITAPTNPEIPGVAGQALNLSLWDYMGEAIQLIAKQLTIDSPQISLLQWLLTILAGWSLGCAMLIYRVLHGLHVWRMVQCVLLLTMKVVMHLFWWRVRGQLDDQATRRAWLIANTGYAHLHGALAADVINKGMDYLDEYDYRDWLSRYIYPDMVDGSSLTLASPLVQFIYDAQFSYLDGDLKRPNIAAGASLRTVIRMAFTCKGALLWRMQAAMGDTVFTPLVQLLQRKGVKFAYFHQIKALRLSPDGLHVAAIDGVVQAELKDPSTGYQPWLEIKGLDCWPSEPLWSQLKDGERLRLDPPPYESFDFHGGRPFTLAAGRDYDEVIYGMPIATIPHLAAELLTANEHWRGLIEHLKTVRTQALQIWTSAAKGSLGVPGEGQPLLATYHPTPMNTMADMTFLSEREAWPATAGRYPLSQFYFCGPLAESPGTGGGSLAQQQQQDHQVLVNAQDLLGKLAAPLFPSGTVPTHTPGAPFDWRLLIDNHPAAPAGEERLKAQYLRANISPSERFTLSNSGSTKYRIKPGDSGFRNLKLAGDWTNNSFNIANIEATVMSGMLCAQAIAGVPTNAEIIGYGFGAKPT